MTASYDSESDDQSDESEDRGDPTADQPREAFALAGFSRCSSEGER
jgi:hypothetical protein